MSTKKIVQTISEKEMDRKQFLKYSGYALLSLVGLKGVVNLLTPVKEVRVESADQNKSKRGFGSGKYGA